MISYDDVPQIRELYLGFSLRQYGLSYSVQERYCGSEVMFFCPGLNVPNVMNPAKISASESRELSYDVARLSVQDEVT